MTDFKENSYLHNEWANAIVYKFNRHILPKAARAHCGFNYGRSAQLCEIDSRWALNLSNLCSTLPDIQCLMYSMFFSLFPPSQLSGGHVDLPQSKPRRARAAFGRVPPTEFMQHTTINMYFAIDESRSKSQLVQLRNKGRSSLGYLCDKLLSFP